MRPSTRSLVALFLPSLEGGGAERVMLNLAIGLSQRGFQTDLVLASADGPYLSSVPASVRVIDLKARRVIMSLLPLVRYLRRERPATLLAGLDHANIVAVAAARIARTGTRTAMSIHCTFPAVTGETSWSERIIPRLLGLVHPWADAIIPVSEGVADDVSKKTGIPRDRLDVIYNPVITPALFEAARQPLEPFWRDGAEQPLILGVGRLIAQKNFPLLIEAFAKVRRDQPVRLAILGEGPARGELEAQIERLGLQDCVALPGFVSNPYAWMKRANVFVLSSDFEGLPTVLIESLALGTPVVATDCESGPREILRCGVLGELVRLGDASGLAQAIVRTLKRPRTPAPADALLPFTLDAVLDRFQATCDLHA